MKNDEFNFVEIKNEREGFSNFEFGSTQNAEFTSYADNKNSVRDEVNDNPASNNENKSPDKKEKRRKEEQNRKEESDKSSNGSSGSSASSSAGGVGAVGAAVSAAVCVAIGIVSVGAGPLSPEVDNVIFTPHETSINCAFDIFNDDSLVKYKVELYNDGIDDHFEKESQIGHNELEFTDLASSTEYTFEIFRGNPNEQQEYTYESIYSEVVSTLEYTGSIVLSFDSDGRQGTMSSIELDANESYTLPVSIFVPKDDEYFAGWKINGEGEMLQPGQTVSLKNDTTLVAGWNKFPTKETVVPAGSNLFRYFPSEPSPIITTVSLMGVDFQCQYTSYDSSSEALQLSSTGGFVSTSTPFGGPITKISITTDSTQRGVVNYTVVYSEYPIYEKVTEGGETQALDSYSTYTFNSINPDARYFCLSNESSDIDARIMTIEFTYLLPVIENSFQVYFDANGGEGTFGPYTVRNTNKEELPSIEDIEFEAPEGYEFAGWKVKGVNDLLEAGTLIGISSDITLVAQWKPAEPKTNYTIRFDANGGTGTMASVQVEKGSTYYIPEVSEWTFVPPEGRTYSNSWFLVNGSRKNKAIPITVNSDLTIANDWDFAAMLYFSNNGGEGRMEPTRTTGYYTFPECPFTPPEGMIFEAWTFSTSSGPTGNYYQPGDQTFFEPSNIDEIKEYTIYPEWVQNLDTTFKIHIDSLNNYLLELDDNPSETDCKLNFTYSYEGSEYPYTTTKMYFDVNGSSVPNYVDLSDIISGTSGQVKSDNSVTIDSIIKEYFMTAQNGLVEYTVVGIDGNNQDELAKGVFSPQYIEQGYVGEIMIGGNTLTSEGTYNSVIFNQGHFYLPFNIRMSDYNHEYFGTSFNYDLSYVGGDDNFTYKGGTSYLPIDSIPSSTATLGFGANTHADQFEPATGVTTAEGITLGMSSSGTIFGFELNENILASGSSTQLVRVVANTMGTDKNHYKDLDVDSAVLVFNFKTAYNRTTQMTFDLDFNVDVDLLEYIEFNVTNPNFFHYLRCYPCDVGLLINGTNEYNSYQNYSFKSL